ncbi:glutathione S-transferase family protein [Sphingomonas sp.]|uniref:glutathione S-transferase family protein n=1 Tax=Sphingomonas sp. TaxID=28214 RepID=UPI0025CC361C|nr:glutathione S-transferase family protein [Sphingomonas sp.]MBV9529089.1 glutathione S-transferase family protein [Sphingomonas sp.]
MLIVHHLGISQSDRIVWLCEELGLDFELRRYDRDPVTKLAPPEYRALHRFGTAPVIQHDDLTLGETGAIFEYLIAIRDGRLGRSLRDADFADYLYWLHFGNGSFVPAGVNTMIVRTISGGSGDHTLGIFGDRLRRAYESADERLGETPYFAGTEFSAADIMMVFPLTTMRAFAPVDLAPYPNIRAYLGRIGQRPAFRRAMAKADPGFEVHLT